MTDQVLSSAISNNDLKTVKSLLPSGVPVDFLLMYGRTPLMRASAIGNSEMVKYLLQNGASVNHHDYNGSTPLLFAVQSDNPEIVETLIQSGASVDSADKSGRTALIDAAFHNNIDIVRILLRAGASTDPVDFFGQNAYFSSSNKDVRNLIAKAQYNHRKLEKFDDLQKDRETYFYVIPRDLIGLIRGQLDNKNL